MISGLSDRGCGSGVITGANVFSLNYKGTLLVFLSFFFFQAEDGIRDLTVTGVQTCALPISARRPIPQLAPVAPPVLPLRRADRGGVAVRSRSRCATLRHRLEPPVVLRDPRSEEHTSELQSQSNLVCRLLLEKKKTNTRAPLTLTVFDWCTQCKISPGYILISSTTRLCNV